jgi:hypothetical protein
MLTYLLKFSFFFSRVLFYKLLLLEYILFVLNYSIVNNFDIKYLWLLYYFMFTQIYWEN